MYLRKTDSSSKKNKMEPYQNLSGNSGIKAYEILYQAIKIEFTDGSIYRYDYNIPGERQVKIMKALAKKGIGLTTFINQEVRENFAEKLT